MSDLERVAPWIGRVVDDTYRIDEVLGAGGFGIVYKAFDQRLGRRVAIKVPRADRCEQHDLLRFLAEARNLASLNHPNVVHVHRLGEFEGQHYIDLEYLEGDTLALVISEGRFTIRERLEIIQQVARGLGAMHGLGILHRDLSPQNIIVDASGTPRIFDLGLSLDTRQSRTMSMDGLKGTLGYFSPEQLQNQPVTVQGEIFTFGVILFELLCGENPFTADHDATTLYNVAHRDPTPIESLLPACPPDLATLVKLCLAKTPNERPVSMADVDRWLAKVLAGSGLDSSVRPATTTRTKILTSSANPYLQRVMIKNRTDFFGRRAEVQRIFSRLNASPPGSISIVGDRKVGKSSLLNHVHAQAQRQELLEQPERMVMAYVDAQIEKNMTIPTFVEMLLDHVTLEVRGRVDLADCTHDLDGVRAMVERLMGANIRLGVLLDEFEAITSNANFDLEFFSFMRYLANHFDVAYVTASARNLQVLCHTKEISDSPFFNIFSTMRLSAFNRAEAEDLVRVPSSRVGRPLEKWTDQILELSGLFPLYIQMACSNTLEYVEEHTGGEPDFKEIKKRFNDEAVLHYRYQWDNFDPHEREALLKVATGKTIPEALRHVVEELQTKRYVLAGEPLRLFAGPFEEFVRTHASPERHSSFFNWAFNRGKGS